MKPFLEVPRPWLIAHRGGAALAPENTLTAFDRAVALGASCLELDVRLTLDGEVVVFHDADTARTCGEAGPVERRTLAEVSRLDAGHGFTPDGGRTFPFRGDGVRVPTLQALLARHPEVRLNIEAKSEDPALAEALVATIRRAGAASRVCVGSELDRQGARLRALLPEACHFLSRGPATREVLAAALGLGGFLSGSGCECAEIPLRAGPLPLATPAVVRRLQARGLAVLVWTVDDQDQMRRLLAAGVDGIMTDRPDLLSQVLRS